MKSSLSGAISIPSVKTIFVYLNGVENGSPKKVLLDARKLKNWFRMLQEITRAIDQQIIVKRVFTADGIFVNDFSALDNLECYVVSDQRNYIKIEKGYVDQRFKVQYLNPYSNCALWLRNLKKNLTHIRPDLIAIYVYKNKVPEEDPRKFVLTQNDLSKWKKTLDYIACVLDYPTETIKYLFTTNGLRICGAWELQHGACYVAIGVHEKFEVAPYKESLCSSSRKWKYGVPYLYKPKLELCVHKRPNIQLNSWEHNINWKHFNTRYADFLEDCYICKKNTPCRPQCDCSVHKYSMTYTDSMWSKEQSDSDITNMNITQIRENRDEAYDSEDVSSIDSLKRS